jgi:hypothetical protein
MYGDGTAIIVRLYGGDLQMGLDERSE